MGLWFYVEERKLKKEKGLVRMEGERLMREGVRGVKLVVDRLVWEGVEMVGV